MLNACPEISILSPELLAMIVKIVQERHKSRPDPIPPMPDPIPPMPGGISQDLTPSAPVTPSAPDALQTTDQRRSTACPELQAASRWRRVLQPADRSAVAGARRRVGATAPQPIVSAYQGMLLGSLTMKQAIIFFVGTNPDPNVAAFVFHSERPMIAADPS